MVAFPEFQLYRCTVRFFSHGRWTARRGKCFGSSGGRAVRNVISEEKEKGNALRLKSLTVSQLLLD